MKACLDGRERKTGERGGCCELVGFRCFNLGIWDGKGKRPVKKNHENEKKPAAYNCQYHVLIQWRLDHACEMCPSR